MQAKCTRVPLAIIMAALALLQLAAPATQAEFEATPPATRTRTTMHDALLGLPFGNSDVITATTSFAMRPVGSIYLECEAPTKSQWAWADGRITPFHQHHYLYAQNSSAHSADPYNASMLGGWSVPPSGMRSAPPLGGLAAGSVELRGDGSLRAWTIENASPAGSTKLDLLDDAAFGVLVGKGESRLLRTHPPAGLPGVQSMRFSGSQPFTRLVPSDPKLNSKLHLRLFGRSRWRVGDMEKSAIPAAAFTLTASNPSTSEPLNISFFFSLPFSLQHGILRDNNGAVANATAGAAETCRAACAANASCLAWNLGGESCVQFPGSAVPNARNSPANVVGVASGISGRWAKGTTASNCATLHRPGTHAAAGNISLCAAAESETASPAVSFGSGPDLNSLWQQFSGSGGQLDESTLGDQAVGAAAVTLTLPPGSNGSATISLGWYLPHRDFMGGTVGNHYVDLVDGSEHAATIMLPLKVATVAAVGTSATGPVRAVEAVGATADVQDWGKFAAALTASPTMPTWLGDSLLNSLHHYRSAMWLGDGRWRQWESFSCVNVDSVHNDGERHLAYLNLLGPEGTVSKMRAWAAGALPDGMIQEQLACGCMDAVPSKLDQACGRVMGDVSSMFIVYLLELMQWTDDTASILC